MEGSKYVLSGSYVVLVLLSVVLFILLLVKWIALSKRIVSAEMLSRAEFLIQESAVSVPCFRRLANLHLDSKSPTELMLKVTCQFASNCTVADNMCLVDSGCQVFAVAPYEFFGSQPLIPAARPLRLTSVDNESIVGGTQGLWVDMDLPVWNGQKRYHRKVKAFIHAAALPGRVVIFGYPFLVKYSLAICPWLPKSALVPRSCITIAPPTQKSLNRRVCESYSDPKPVRAVDSFESLDHVNSTVLSVVDSQESAFVQPLLEHAVCIERECEKYDSDFDTVVNPHHAECECVAFVPPVAPSIEEVCGMTDEELSEE